MIIFTCENNMSSSRANHCYNNTTNRTFYNKRTIELKRCGISLVFVYYIARERVKYFSTREEKFVSPRGHVISSATGLLWQCFIGNGALRLWADGTHGNDLLEWPPNNSFPVGNCRTHELLPPHESGNRIPFFLQESSFRSHKTNESGHRNRVVFKPLSRAV